MNPLEEFEKLAEDFRQQGIEMGARAEAGKEVCHILGLILRANQLMDCSSAILKLIIKIRQEGLGKLQKS